jgi:hypothetical protein
MALRQTEEFYCVSVPKDIQCFRIHLCHHWRHFWWTEDSTLEQSCLELALQLAFTPPLPDGKAQVELAFFRVLALLQNDQVMRPGQL